MFFSMGSAAISTRDFGSKDFSYPIKFDLGLIFP